jgi:hypothetical protein
VCVRVCGCSHANATACGAENTQRSSCWLPPVLSCAAHTRRRTHTHTHTHTVAHAQTHTHTHTRARTDAHAQARTLAALCMHAPLEGMCPLTRASGLVGTYRSSLWGVCACVCACVCVCVWARACVRASARASARARARVFVCVAGVGWRVCVACTSAHVSLCVRSSAHPCAQPTTHTTHTQDHAPRRPEAGQGLLQLDAALVLGELVQVAGQRRDLVTCTHTCSGSKRAARHRADSTVEATPAHPAVRAGGMCACVRVRVCWQTACLQMTLKAPPLARVQRSASLHTHTPDTHTHQTHTHTRHTHTNTHTHTNHTCPK